MPYRRAVSAREACHVRIDGKLDEKPQDIRCGDENNVCQSPTYAAYPELPFKRSIQGPEERKPVPALAVRFKRILYRCCKAPSAAIWMDQWNVIGLKWPPISCLETKHKASS